VKAVAEDTGLMDVVYAALQSKEDQVLCLHHLVTLSALRVENLCA
jgi:hypothetical protein